MRVIGARRALDGLRPSALWQRTAGGISRDALLLLLSTVLSSIPVGALAIVLPIYLKRIHFNPLGIGVLYTVSGLVSAVLLFLVGILADRFSRKPFLVLGTTMPAVSYVMFLTNTDPRVLTLASAIGGVGLAGGLGGALATSAFNALLASLVDEEHRTRAFSLNESGWALALTLGSVAAGLPELLQSWLGLGTLASYHIVFVCALALAICGVLVLLPIREPGTVSLRERWRGRPRAREALELPVSAEHEHAPAPGRRHWLPRQSRREIIYLSLVLGLLGLGLGFITQLLPLWFYLRFGANEAALGPWYAAAEALAVAATLLAPRAARRWGSVRAVVILQGASAALLLAMAAAPALAIAAVLYVGRQAAMTGSWPIQQAYAMTVVEPGERATASSAAYGTWGLASSVTPVLGGRWLQANLFALPLVAGAACYALSVALFDWLFRRREKVRW